MTRTLVVITWARGSVSPRLWQLGGSVYSIICIFYYTIYNTLCISVFYIYIYTPLNPVRSQELSLLQRTRMT